MGDYPDAIDCFVDRSRVFVNQNSHSAIVIHGTGGSSDQTALQLGQFFATTPSMVSVHYGIDRAGNVAQYVLEVDGACGNCCTESGYDPFWNQFVSDNLNLHTISIEHVNDISNSLPLTPEQQDASFKLVKWLCERYDISTENVKSHASIAPLSRAHCPGDAYPWNALFEFLKEDTMLDLTDPVVSTFFTDGGNGTWKCKKNGVPIWGENLKFYRSNGGPALLGLPLASEIHIPLSPEIAIVPCERALIVYDPQKKLDAPPIAGPCYLLHLQEGVGQQLLMQGANSTIKNLTDKINQIHSLSA